MVDLMPYGYGHMAWFGLWWFLLFVLLIAVVWAVAAVARRSGGAPPGPRPPAEAPEDIVRRRYAGGEIDRETYERILADLRK
jgi:putative membrane protein